MRQLVCLWVPVVLLGLSPGPAGSPGRTADEPPRGGSSPRIANYTITARLDHGKRQIAGTLRLDWKNTSQQVVTELPFHLYLNAFKNSTTLWLTALRSESFRSTRKLPGKKEWGHVSVSEVRVDGLRARESRPASDGTVLRVKPARPIAPGVTARITMNFVSRLPKVIARTGYHRDFYLVGQWFPKIGVLDPDGTWHCHPFYLTTEFYADFGVYRVTLDVPRRFDVAASGRRMAPPAVAGDRRRITYLAEDVHDFAWTAAPGLRRITRRQGRRVVQVVSTDAPRAKAREHLDVTVRSLALLERWFGPYPYDTLTVVLVPAGADEAGGMEYPTLITSSARHEPFLERATAFGTTVHELCHQYFYGLLASDEYREAWLDEGFTTYVTGWVVDELYGPDRSIAEVGPLKLGYFPAMRLISRGAGSWDPPLLRSSDFAHFRSYGSAVYGKAALSLRTLEGQIGRRRMQALLRDYVRRHRFTHPSSTDFFGVLDRHVPEPLLRGFFRQAIRTPGGLDYEVARLRSTKTVQPRGVFTTSLDRQRRDEARRLARKRYRNVVLLHRKGELTIPVDVELRFAGGSRMRRRWDGQARWHRIVVHSNRRLQAAVLDPDRRLMLDRSLLNNGLSRRPDPRPARRLGGRLLSALQVLLQLVGF